MKAIIILALLAVALSLRFDHERVAISPAEKNMCMAAANKVIGNRNGVLSYGSSNFNRSCRNFALLSSCSYVGDCQNAKGVFVQTQINLNLNPFVKKACCSYN